jgi:hypothetical protein
VTGPTSVLTGREWLFDEHGDIVGEKEPVMRYAYVDVTVDIVDGIIRAGTQCAIPDADGGVPKAAILVQVKWVDTAVPGQRLMRFVYAHPTFAGTAQEPQRLSPSYTRVAACDGVGGAVVGLGEGPEVMWEREIRL